MRVTTELGASRFCVDGDAVRLRRVFANLIKNTDASPPRRAPSRCVPGIAEDRVVVEVSDSGEGSGRRHSGRIFNRFEQARAPPQERGGLGLGRHSARVSWTSIVAR
jgi:K+-sensing histidine kinase KdpD